MKIEHQLLNWIYEQVNDVQHMKIYKMVVFFIEVHRYFT